MLNFTNIYVQDKDLKTNKRVLGLNHLWLILVVGPLIIVLFCFFLIWQPAQVHIRVLEEEKTSWEKIITSYESAIEPDIPGMSQLPDLFELCKQVFNQRNIIVTGLYVERFASEMVDSNGGENKELGYALVHLELSGSWEGIEESLSELQHLENAAVNVEEVKLDSGKAESILKVYFRQDF